MCFLKKLFIKGVFAIIPIFAVLNFSWFFNFLIFLNYPASTSIHTHTYTLSLSLSLLRFLSHRVDRRNHHRPIKSPAFRRSDSDDFHFGSTNDHPHLSSIRKSKDGTFLRFPTPLFSFNFVFRRRNHKLNKSCRD